MKKIIAIVAGGDSGEYEISVKSAAVVEKYIDKDLYDTYRIIFKKNVWSYTDSDGREHLLDKNNFRLNIGDRMIQFDAVFIAIHGTPGEDGKLQGYLDMMGVPYTTCDHATSALTFNKFFCSSYVSSLGYQVSPSCILHKAYPYDIEFILKKTGLPCFVKPNNGGSSVGMSKVDHRKDMQAAIEKAFAEDEQVLVEAFIPGREITCGVFTFEGKARSLPITEIISKNEFFDFEAKYTDGMAEEITPANISDDTEKLCRKISESLYSKLNCRGLVRFDYIFNESGMYFLEVNTVPGLSANSIVPQQAAEDGISLTELFSLSLSQALEG